MNYTCINNFLRGSVYLVFSIVLVSCEKPVEQLSDQELLNIITSNQWTSESFVYQDVSGVDSIELLAMAIDTIYNTIPLIYPGDQYRAIIWVDLVFGQDNLFISDRKSISYLKCIECTEFSPVYEFSEPFFGKFSLNDNRLTIETRNKGEWNNAGTYRIEYLSDERIKIYEWISLPLSTDSVQIDVTHINGIQAESKDYVFDVIFRAIQEP